MALRPDEVVITAAIVGAELTRDKTPYLPLTPEELAREAKRCREAGAAVIHLHARRADGSPTQDAAAYQAAVDAIRAETDVVVQVSTGGAVGMSVDERLGALACSPEMATLNCGTINFGDEIFANAWPDMRRIAMAIAEAGVVPELELYEIGHLDAALRFVNEGLVAAPLHAQFVLGVPGAAGARESVLRFFVSEYAEALARHAPAAAASTWSVAAVGRHQFPMIELALALGGQVRVGLEDNIYLEKGVLAKGSYELVERASNLAASGGRTPVTPSRVRDVLKA